MGECSCPAQPQATNVNARARPATKPGGSLYFPVLSTPTGDPRIFTAPEPHPKRGVMMPKRQRPRFEDIASRFAAERKRNAERLALERFRLKPPDGTDPEPPPF
jgi:hypothetical protein